MKERRNIEDGERRKEEGKKMLRDRRLYIMTTRRK